MLNVNLFESLNCIFKCFGGKQDKVDATDEPGLRRDALQTSKQVKIKMLPTVPAFELENLYPPSANVETWNIFIVGIDKTYILASVKDPHLDIPQARELPNHIGNNILPQELTVVFDSIWNKTLAGKQLQFYMVWNGKIFLVNTYPFFSGMRRVIGGILFMRAFDAMPDYVFEPIDQGPPKRTSVDKFVDLVRSRSANRDDANTRENAQSPALPSSPSWRAAKNKTSSS